MDSVANYYDTHFAKKYLIQLFFVFHSLLALSPQDVLPALYLCTNKIAPDHVNMVSVLPIFTTVLGVPLPFSHLKLLRAPVPTFLFTFFKKNKLPVRFSIAVPIRVSIMWPQPK